MDVQVSRADYKDIVGRTTQEAKVEDRKSKATRIENCNSSIRLNHNQNDYRFERYLLKKWWPGTDKIAWNNFGRTQCAPSGAGYMDIA